MLSEDGSLSLQLGDDQIKGGDNQYKQQVRQAVQAQLEAENARNSSEKALKEAEEAQLKAQEALKEAEEEARKNAEVSKPWEIQTIPGGGNLAFGFDEDVVDAWTPNSPTHDDNMIYNDLTTNVIPFLSW